MAQQAEQQVSTSNSFFTLRNNILIAFLIGIAVLVGLGVYGWNQDKSAMKNDETVRSTVSSYAETAKVYFAADPMVTPSVEPTVNKVRATFMENLDNASLVEVLVNRGADTAENVTVGAVGNASNYVICGSYEGDSRYAKNGNGGVVYAYLSVANDYVYGGEVSDISTCSK